MGYDTSYTGEIRLINFDLNKLRYLKEVLEGDAETYNIQADGVTLRHIDLEMNDELTAIVWNGAEKAHGLLQALNYLSNRIGLQYVEGDGFDCEGEEQGDVYRIEIKNGQAVRIDPPTVADAKTIIEDLLGYAEQALEDCKSNGREDEGSMIARSVGEAKAWLAAQ